MLILFILIAILGKLSLASKVSQVMVNDEACIDGLNARITETAGTIVSPLKSHSRPINITCTWVIQNPHVRPMILR